ncbi:Wyosine [tRNA(Phe)-imidazoG37] synthetase, radical SAM superfamily [Draconibacterium orientale]|uniref:Wyosine [tRNA(Phe)-imidazoG37] synthetase, radical SAM superfamily n=1 Tax=Draconibacterium orientale TaxID=1168034 RepID=A0A1I0JW01_9BACT|nr:radical SAM protein [Draconibacterium orientale]SEU15075.1 Wyosine [tRNA(Phe)-imidazoG37] synthetase, radical SAM superfamily [Draconibacterium orientale]
MIAFGPVTSRRLGLSLGINNIVSRKVCSYSCIYCQIGETRHMSTNQEVFYAPKKLFKNVEEHLSMLDELHRPDYLTFVSNGEPTLDKNLGEAIQMLRKFEIPIAVITNASLLHHENVRRNLMEADWVSVKVDTTDELTWKKINRPHSSIKLDQVLEGINQFATVYKGKLHSETMLINSYNDSSEQVEQTASFISKINPDTAYLSIPTRPPAMSDARPATEKTLAMAWQIFSNAGITTELLTGFEGTDTGITGNAFEDILNITAVHPLREDTMKALLIKENTDMAVVESLESLKLIKKTKYKGMNYYVRNYHF